MAAAALAAVAIDHAALREQVARQAQTLAEHERSLAEQGEALAEQGVALAYRALHDPLTGLPNRELLEDRTRQALLRATRDGRGAAVFLVETEGLRLINETLGHAAGDELLKEIATRLQASARQTDLLARTGGDEFTFVAADLKDRQGAQVIAQKLLGVLTRAFAAEGGRELFLNPSVGIALYPQDGTDLASLRRNADAALARARDRGRNRFEFFVPEMNDAGALERLEMEGQLRLAVERGELQLHYQPQVDGHGRVVAAEALLRWTHPKLGPVSPGKFIPIAESGGLIVPIGRWVLREVCRQTAAWRRDGALPPVRVAANVSALQFAEPDFVESVEATLRACDLDPRWIELEITESALMDKPEAVADKLARLRRIGVGVAIDDFGTGYSSLAYLHRLPIDTLKIDRSFVLAIGANDAAASPTAGTASAPAGPPASAGVPPPPPVPTRAAGGQAVILAVISLARSLGMNVLAEGVETAAQRDFLVRHGCHLMQGYLFSRPKPPAEVEALLRAAPQAAPKPTLAA
jgi:diguanylate cyclase (GGDEF)-like protein